MVVQTQAVPVWEIERCRTPIFLIGVERSGTSLCRRIVDSHSRIACPPETFFFKQFAAILDDPRCTAGFAGLGFSNRQQLVSEIGKWASMYHESYRVARGKQRWADKTPRYVEILSELEEMFGPTAQYVMIYRHPLEVITSIYLGGGGAKLGNYDPDPLLNAAMYVAQRVSDQLSFARDRPERCFRLHYETLVQDPPETLKALFAFLEEPWEPAVLDFNRFNHNLGTEDSIVMGTLGFKLSWGGLRSLKPEQLDAVTPIVRSVASNLGYSLADWSVPNLKCGVETQFGIQPLRQAKG